jgi:long-chain acyl-CoA synthetase
MAWRRRRTGEVVLTVCMVDLYIVQVRDVECSEGGLVPTSAVESALAELTGEGRFAIVTDATGRRNFSSRPASLCAVLERAAGRGDAEFLAAGDRRISYAEFAALAWGAAHRLRDDLGVQPGERVAIVAANSIEWVVAAFATMCAGGIVVALNDRWTSAERAFALDDSGAVVAIVDATVAASLTGEEGEALREVVVIGDPSVCPGSRPARGFADLEVPAPAPPDVPIREDDPFMIVYTSGTTGTPKGCITTHAGTIAQNTMALLGGLVDRALRPAGGTAPSKPRTQTSLLLTSPLFHVSGFHAGLCLSLTTGAKVVLYDGKFDPKRVLDLIAAERITAWGGVPTVVQRVIAHPDAAHADLSSMETVALGGAPVPPTAVDGARSLLGSRTHVGTSYGMTETQGPVTITGSWVGAERAGSVGRISPIVDVRIIDTDGAVLPAGAVGEICVAGPMVTPGYWNRPAETAAAIRDGWLRTGDLGYVDDGGYLYVVDRAKDMIIRGGENVYCQEIEAALEAMPGVHEAAVFGVADDDLGERVHAAVHADGELTEEAMQSQLRRSLSSFKIPDRIHVLDEPLPRNDVGKLLKARIRDTVSVPAADRSVQA